MENIEFSILESRDKRYKIQKQFYEEYKETLVSFAFNVPGKIKNSKEIKLAFNLFIEILYNNFKDYNLNIIKEIKYNNEVDNFFCCVIKNIDAKVLKKFLIEIEEKTPYGRILDIDVIDKNFKIISRKDLNMKSRKCFLCENEAIYCIRNKSHDYNLLYNKFIEYINMIGR